MAKILRLFFDFAGSAFSAAATAGAFGATAGDLLQRRMGELNATAENVFEITELVHKLLADLTVGQICIAGRGYVEPRIEMIEMRHPGGNGLAILTGR